MTTYKLPAGKDNKAVSGMEMDAVTLAEKLQISARSANRMMAHSEKEGYAVVIGKQSRSSGKGSPSRLLLIELPRDVMC